MNLAVVYFGSIRSIRWTKDSIQQNVIEWNSSRGCSSIVTLASINLFDHIDNPRSGETGIHLNRSDIGLLPTDYKTVIIQDDKDIREEMAAARRHGDFYGDDFRSIRNLLHQLNSLRRAWEAVVENQLIARSDFFLFARPDLRYGQPVRIPAHTRRIQATNTVLLPPWQSFDGFNDRIALADRLGAEVYANRMNLVAEYCEDRPLQAERLLLYCLDLGNTNVGRLDVHAHRVRSDGSVVREAFGKSRRKIPRTPALVSKLSQASNDTRRLRLRNWTSSKLHKR